MTSAPRPDRAATGVDRLADDYLDQSLALNPGKATRIGAPGYDHLLADYSPDGIAARADLDRRTIAALDGVAPQDAVDRVSIDAMRERLGVAVELVDAGAEESQLNVIASPVQEVRSIFDLMPTDTAEQWATIAARLRAVPDAMRGYARSLAEAAGRSHVSPRRQVECVIDQCASYGGDHGFFVTFAESAAAAPDVSPGLAAEVLDAGRQAASGYLELGRFLGEEILPQAPEADGCGREQYAMWSRAFLGAAVDFEEAYAWGQDELARITAEMERTARADLARVDGARGHGRAGPGPGQRAARPRRAAALDAAARRRGGRRARRARTSTSRSRCGPSSAGSPRRTRAASTTPRPATTCPARAGCGGRCRATWTRSRPGAS